MPIARPAGAAAEPCHSLTWGLWTLLPSAHQLIYLTVTSNCKFLEFWGCALLKERNYPLPTPQPCPELHQNHLVTLSRDHINATFHQGDPSLMPFQGQINKQMSDGLLSGWCQEATEVAGGKARAVLHGLNGSQSQGNCLSPKTRSVWLSI
jgi:hypothetical protein